MAKAVWINISGTWKKVKNVWGNVGGIWKQKIIPKGSIGGAWKEFIQYFVNNTNIVTKGFFVHDGDHIYYKINPNTLEAGDKINIFSSPAADFVEKYFGDYFCVLNNLYVYKYDLESGTLLSAVRLPVASTYKSDTRNIFVSPENGDIIVTGLKITTSGSTNTLTTKIARYDSEGNLIFEKDIETKKQSTVYDTSSDTVYSKCFFYEDGSIIVEIGKGYNNVGYINASYFMKIDRLGNIISSKNFTSNIPHHYSNDLCLYRLQNGDILRYLGNNIEIYDTDLEIISSSSIPAGINVSGSIYHTKRNTFLTPYTYSYKEYDLEGNLILQIDPPSSPQHQIKMIDNDLNFYSNTTLTSPLTKHDYIGNLLVTGSKSFYGLVFNGSSLTL